MDKKRFINDVEHILEKELEIININLNENSVFEDIGIDSIALMTIIVSLESIYNCEIGFNIDILKKRTQATLNDLYEMVEKSLKKE